MAAIILKCPNCEQIYRRIPYDNDDRLQCIQCGRFFDIHSVQRGYYDVRVEELDGGLLGCGCGIVLGLLAGFGVFALFIFFKSPFGISVGFAIIAGISLFILGYRFWTGFNKSSEKGMAKLEPLRPLPKESAQQTLFDRRGFEFAPYTDELIRIGRKFPPDTQSASHFLNIANDETRKLGQQLHNTGGLRAMLLVHQRIRESLGTTAARELEAAWNGIGDWRG